MDSSAPPISRLSYLPVNLEVDDNKNNNDDGNDRHRTFAVKLFEFGDCKSCLFAYSFPCCALALARRRLDGSSFCMNCFFLNAVVARWIFRTAYRIEQKTIVPCSNGGAAAEWWMDDWCIGCCCLPCTANQLYQTAQKYGNPTRDGGRSFNIQDYRTTGTENFLSNCLYATFCMPCAVGTGLQRTMGMPFATGCCCAFNPQLGPILATNLMRYHYRLKGDDDIECAVYALLFVFLQGLLVPVLAIPRTIALLTESQSRFQDEDVIEGGSRYLVSYRPTQFSLSSPTSSS